MIDYSITSIDYYCLTSPSKLSKKFQHVLLNKLDKIYQIRKNTGMIQNNIKT